jgi:hypothetical protein
MIKVRLALFRKVSREFRSGRSSPWSAARVYIYEAGCYL